MALEFIIYAGNQTIHRWTCLEPGCGASWGDGQQAQNTHCIRCLSTNVQEDDVGYKDGDIITLDYSPSNWTDAEKETVVYMADSEVEKLWIRMGYSSERELWEYLDSPKVVNGLVTARKAYRVSVPFKNLDKQYIVIKAKDVIRK